MVYTVGEMAKKLDTQHVEGAARDGILCRVSNIRPPVIQLWNAFYLVEGTVGGHCGLSKLE